MSTYCGLPHLSKCGAFLWLAAGFQFAAAGCGSGAGSGRSGASTTSASSGTSSGTVTTGCRLAVTPNPLNYGNAPLNIVTTDSIVLSNAGGLACDVSQLALEGGSSPLFSLPSSQPLAFSVAPGASQTIQVAFAASDSSTPHLRTGALTFSVADSGGANAQPQSVAMEAYINTACTQASAWIYTIDQRGTLSTFDPLTLTYTDLGKLTCPDSTSPISMAIDQSAIAWVEYSSGNLYRVDVTDPTLTCTATGYQPGSQISTFGMGFLFEPTTGLDTLYIAGNASFPSYPSTLGTIDFPGMAMTEVAPLAFGGPELTGTGDGQLWGFALGFSSADGLATLANIDPATGHVLESFSLPQITSYGAFAVKFWGGSLWLFVGSDVYQVDRASGALTAPTIVNPHGPDGQPRSIVGAGVSTCAPVQ